MGVAIPSEAHPYEPLVRTLVEDLHTRGWTPAALAGCRFACLDESLPFQLWSVWLSRPRAEDVRLVKAYLALQWLAEHRSPGSPAARDATQFADEVVNAIKLDTAIDHIGELERRAMAHATDADLGRRRREQQTGNARKRRDKLADGTHLHDVIRELVRGSDDRTPAGLWQPFLGELREKGLDPQERGTGRDRTIFYTGRAHATDASRDGKDRTLSYRYFSKLVNRARTALEN
jgi:hypothetical protein